MRQVNLAVQESIMGDFDERCEIDRSRALTRLAVRYSRDPAKRQEQWKDNHPRIPLKVADSLETRRASLVFFEFSPTWIKRDGELP